MTAADPTSPSTHRGSYGSVMCAVDGSRGSAEAVRQAIRLCNPSGLLRMVAVTDVRGSGANRMAGLGEQRAEQALAAAVAVARESGVRVEKALLYHAEPKEELLRASADHDLLAVGTHPGSRAAGIFLGRTVTYLAHQTTRDLLIARPHATPETFPQRILVALTADETSGRLVERAGCLAGELGAQAAIVHVPLAGDGPAQRRDLASLSMRLFELTGSEPIVHTPNGLVVGQIVRAATERTDLVVIGGRGRTGLRALGSVSERVAHESPCSVLICRS